MHLCQSDCLCRCQIYLFCAFYGNYGCNYKRYSQVFDSQAKGKAKRVCLTGQVAVLVEVSHVYSLLLLTIIMHLIRTFIDEVFDFVFGIFVLTRKSTASCYCSVGCRYKARDQKSKGRRQLNIVSQVIPDVTIICVD